MSRPETKTDVELNRKLVKKREEITREGEHFLGYALIDPKLQHETVANYSSENSAQADYGRIYPDKKFRFESNQVVLSHNGKIIEGTGEEVAKMTGHAEGSHYSMVFQTQ